MTLEEYNKECAFGWTLERLINSHRRQRQLLQEIQEEDNAERDKRLAALQQYAEKCVLDGEYIKISKLKTLTLEQLSEYWS